MSNHSKGKIKRSQWELEVNTHKWAQVRENMTDQVAIGFTCSFASDWLRGWHKFSRPITEHGKAKPM